MSQTNSALQAADSFSPEALNDLIIDAIQGIKGKQIVKLDLRQLDDRPTDYFIICQGTSNTQVKAIADRVRERVKKEAQTLPSHVEGVQMARWVLMDYFSTVVHIFLPEARDFYELEDLWSDAASTEYNNL